MDLIKVRFEAYSSLETCDTKQMTQSLLTPAAGKAGAGGVGVGGDVVPGGW